MRLRILWHPVRFSLAVALGVFAALASQPNFDVSPRRELNFSTGWIYVPRDEPGVEKPGFNDSAFERVSVPHANIFTPHEMFDPDMFRFVSWYRKHFRPDEEFRGKRVYVEFQGVMTVADVYLNGQLLGHHAGGYTPFTIDLTSGLEFGKENVLAVRVDSREQKQVPPEGADKLYGFYLFGGIQRDVQLHVVDPLHIASVYYTTSSITPEVKVDAHVTLVNDRAAEVSGVLVLRLLDGQGREVASTRTAAKLAAGASEDLSLKFERLTGMRLWDVDHPNRYVVLAELRSGQSIVDRQRTWIGIRTIHWDTETGQFNLNGRALKLRGMNRHQTFAYIGGAAPNRLQRRDAHILKFEMGLNMVRSSHYPPDPEFLDECDRIGLLVMDEFPVWQYVGKSQEWQDNAVRIVREMILRDRNHPSIIVWGVRGNEASSREEDDREFYARTYGLVRELDPSRPPGGARDSGGWHGKMVPEEVLTVNDYTARETWPQPVTGKPWIITEYGDPEQFPIWNGERDLFRFTLRWMGYLEGIYKHTELAGGVGWAAFDYNSPEFNTPQAVIAHHCVDDLFRLPKGFSAPALESQADPAFYGYNVKIMTYWRRSMDKIYVASNAEEVELVANSKPLGRRKPTEFPHLPHPLFIFDAPPFEPGELVARAFAGGKIVATDTVRTPGPARKLLLQADDPELIADGADMTRVVIFALDEAGIPVPTEDRGVHLEVQNGRFIGENPIHLEGGRVAVYVQSREGETLPIEVRVSAAGLEPNTLRVNVKAPTSELVPLSDFDADGLATLEMRRKTE